MTMLKRICWYGVLKYLILPFGVVLAKKTGGSKQTANKPKIRYSAKKKQDLF